MRKLISLGLLALLLDLAIQLSCLPAISKTAKTQSKSDIRRSAFTDCATPGTTQTTDDERGKIRENMFKN